MVNKQAKDIKVLEKIRDAIVNLPEVESPQYTGESCKVVIQMTDYLDVLRKTIPNFKELWHEIRLTINLGASLYLPLKDMAKALNEIIPTQKSMANAEFIQSVPYRVSNFSSELSDLLESISDLGENDLKNLPSQVSCMLLQLAWLSKELEQTINSKISSK